MKIEKYLNRVLLKKLARNLVDPRRSARKWSFDSLIGAATRAMLSGCKNLRELEFLTAGAGRRVPDTTMSDFLRQLPAEQLEQELVRGVKEASRSHELDSKELPIRLTVIDGKCLSTASYDVGDNWLHRSQGSCTKYVAMSMRAYLASSRLKLHLAQSWVPKGTNERGAFKVLLEKLLAQYGRTQLLEVISVDAGITSIKNAQLIIDSGLHYIMALKNANWSRMTQQAMDLLQSHERPAIIEKERVSGKTITRKLFRCTAPVLESWQHARQVWRIEKTTVTNTKTVSENHYYVTSLPKSRLSDKQVLMAIRFHWNIENNANWVLDTAWKEDKNPWSNKALEVISLLRLLAYNAVARLRARKLGKVRTPINWKNTLYAISRTLFPFSKDWVQQFA